MNIYDVAQKSGVSIATVSRVLNGSDKVSLTTRQKVLSVMADGHYAPNAFARGLGLNTMRMVGVLCTDIAVDFYAEAVALIESALRRKGLKVILRCTGDDVTAKADSITELSTQGVDALILVGSPFREKINNDHLIAAAAHVPIILINGYLDLENVYCVFCDERRLMRDAVVALHQNGYQTPLYVSLNNRYSNAYKLDGYREGMAVCHQPYDESHVILCENAGFDAVGEALDIAKENHVNFDSVLCTNDQLGIMAQRHLKAAVPVIGFNNSALGEYCTPTLTSLDNMLSMMCRVAISLLDGLLNGNEPQPTKTCISGRIVYRDSFRKKTNQSD